MKTAMLEQLTPRENQILNLILDERSNNSIAKHLGISEKTVESHRKSIYLKAHTKTVVGLVKKVLKMKRSK
ncbi:MAG: LuxR C-terminal-related transcriptional regulator [Reichenbachiella sp.]|uniref:LuxR C-terminal-related transcriptional regulator n=1 Tax=Reichenbachiella sp. TaxID=2184521 RepID=UPI0032662B57